MSATYLAVAVLDYGVHWRWALVAYGTQTVASGHARTQAAARKQGAQARQEYLEHTKRIMDKIGQLS